MINKTKAYLSDFSEYSVPFPLDDVEIRRVKNRRTVSEPLASNEWMSISATEFSMDVEKVGSFYAANGNVIEFVPDKTAGTAAIELYMNGSVYGAILHQRRILPLHGSSFIYNNRVVMLCGDSGAGKSSLTASFCFNGAEFLTDDVTPILFEEDKPRIWPKSGRVKLWNDSLKQLKKKKENLTKIRPEDDKYYFPIKSDRQKQVHPLHHILILKISGSKEVTFDKVEKTEAFSYLHGEIYRREFLRAMPKTEAAYLRQISSICNYSRICSVQRPDSISIDTMQRALAEYLKDNGM